MFGIKKKGAEIKPPVYVVLVPEVAAYASAASFPVDSAGKLVFSTTRWSMRAANIRLSR